MGIRILLLVAVLVGLMYLASWLGKATPAQRASAIRSIIIYGVGAALLILVLTGRIHWLFALVGAAAPWIQRAMMAMRAWNTFKSVRGPAGGQRSSVNTAYLAMTLDHDTGDIDGEILSGALKGQRLSSLELGQLLTLLEECRGQDPQSAPLIEAYLDRHHGPEWRGDDTPGDYAAPPAESQITTEEALAILGLEHGASKRDIQSAHRSLMQKLHPDRGGSAYFATRINQARDVLLDKKKRGTSA